MMGAALGLEWAGEVEAVGVDVKEFKPGDRVVCSGSGGYAEYAVSDYGRTVPLPAGFSFEQAAVLPVALHTLHNALITQGRLKAGESVLIQGASSGVGLMGLQIAKMKGARARDGLRDQRCAPRAAEGIRRRPGDRHARREMAGSGA